MAAHHDKHTMEQMRAQVACADSELGTAQHCLNPGSGEGAEMDLIRAATNAIVALGDALETVQLRLGERTVGRLVVPDFALPC